MKCFYDQTSNPSSNFGAALNCWLWPQLSPQMFEGQKLLEEKGDASGHSSGHSSGHLSGHWTESSAVFLGAGTLLNQKTIDQALPATKLVIFGTGVGYEPSLKAVPISWDIRCLRGPLSAQRLGLPASKAITDSGLLIAQVFEASSARSGCSFMPQVDHASLAADSWQRICQQAGVRYIDPRWPVEKILRLIASSDRLLSESLYGAIAADALRIPWLPIVSSPRIYSFKWQDWCSSLNLFYHPYRLPALKDYSRYDQSLQSTRHWLETILEGPISTYQYELLADESAIAHRLANIAKQVPLLSAEAVFTQKLDALQNCFAQFCQQYMRDRVMQ
ncbi:MAG: polysaccharide pyruvyl transferase family protein [Phormidesmis sp.]